MRNEIGGRGSERSVSGEMRMADRAMAHEGINFAWNSQVDEILGDGAETGNSLVDTRDGQRRALDAAAFRRNAARVEAGRMRFRISGRVLKI